MKTQTKRDYTLQQIFSYEPIEWEKMSKKDKQQYSREDIEEYNQQIKLKP